MPKSDRFALSAVPDVLPPELVRLLAIAQKEITEHSNDHGLCVVCELPFPRPRAELAAFTLDAV
jgi:hypothetical protein